jgi:AraC-like DNA-binding protein
VVDAIEQRCFRNPSRPGLRMEVLSYAQLRRRVPQPGFTRLHALDFHHLTLIDRGESTTTIDFVDHPCQPGTLLHVRPGQVQRLPHTADGEPGDHDGTLILFTPDFPARQPATTPLTDAPFGRVHWQLTPADHTLFRRALADLTDAYTLPPDHAPDTVRELLRHQLTAILLRVALLPAADNSPGGGREGPVAENEPYRLFRHELERSFAVRHQAQDYATGLGYSLKTLNRACTRATGRSAKQLIDDRIALEAKRLLAHTGLPVAAISHRLGFTEPTNFSKFFTRASGQTPGAFREAQAI